MKFLPLIPLALLAACSGGTFTSPLPDDVLQPLLVLDLSNGSLTRSPDGAVPTAQRLIFRRIRAVPVTVANADQLVEAGDISTATTTLTSSRSLWMCTHEISQAQWNLLAPSLANPWNNVRPLSAGGGSAAVGETMPAWGLAALDCTAALNAFALAHPGLQLRLPTTQEWETAARSPTNAGLYGWGDDPAQATTYALVQETIGGSPGPRPIAGRKALGGFFDLHGNVWEWVSDGASYHLRGGSWNDGLRSARSGNRKACSEDLGYALAGCRPVIVLP